MWVVFWLLAVVFVKSVWLFKVYNLLPLHELKRRAKTGDKSAAAIARVAGQAPAVDLLLILLAAFSGTFVAGMAARHSWWAGAIAILAEALVVLGLPKPKAGGWSWKAVAFGSAHSQFLKKLEFILPALKWLARPLPIGSKNHSGLYEREDLLNLLSNQARQLDNRIPAEDLKIALGALTFGDKKVANIMTPRRQVRFVVADEVVGPMLMDELHKTGFFRFPVVREPIRKNIQPEVIGILQLNDLLKHLKTGGPVSRIMHGKAVFIHESANLRQALDAISKHKQQLLIVVNDFEEVVGVITLDNVIEQIIGPQMFDEFDNYEDLRSVAKQRASHLKPQENAEPLVGQAIEK